MLYIFCTLSVIYNATLLNREAGNYLHSCSARPHRGLWCPPFLVHFSSENLLQYHRKEIYAYIYMCIYWFNVVVSLSISYDNQITKKVYLYFPKRTFDFYYSTKTCRRNIIKRGKKHIRNVRTGWVLTCISESTVDQNVGLSQLV